MSGGRRPLISDEEILEVFDEADDPWLTTSEVADAFGFSNRGIRDRLNPLHEAGELKKKRAGRTDIWWLPKRGD